jgi:hypothetical protein
MFQDMPSQQNGYDQNGQHSMPPQPPQTTATPLAVPQPNNPISHVKPVFSGQQHQQYSQNAPSQDYNQQQYVTGVISFEIHMFILVFTSANIHTTAPMLSAVPNPPVMGYAPQHNRSCFIFCFHTLFCSIPITNIIVTAYDDIDAKIATTTDEYDIRFANIIWCVSIFNVLHSYFDLFVSSSSTRRSTRHPTRISDQLSNAFIIAIGNRSENIFTATTSTWIIVCGTNNVQ